MSSPGLSPAPDPAPRLDRATLTVSVFPEAGEASVIRGTPPQVRGPKGTRGAAVDPERSLAASLARTRRIVRRWCAHHGVTRLATLTFAEEPDLDGGWAAVERFRRRLDAANIPQPLIVPEYGSKGGRLHFHCAMTAYVPKDRLLALWGEGFVDVRKIRVRGAHVGGREAARVAAHYVAGYVSKGASGGAGGDTLAPGTVGLNRRRYSIPKGTTPAPVRFSCLGSLYDCWLQIEELCGFPMREVWNSSSDEEWRGPPIMLLMG